MDVVDDITDLTGGTPLVRLDPFGEGLLGKLEAANPGGSVKDRIGVSMLDCAERGGALGPETTVVEPTSGNTGIGLAMACAARGYDCILVMPESMSAERRTLLSAFGADVVLTDAEDGMDGAVEAAEHIAATLEDAFVPQQFGNDANPRAHREGTGPELWKATDGRLDRVVAGVGTGGTVTGVGEYLAERDAEVELVGVEPAGSPVLSEGEDAAGDHGIQGIGAGFVPEVLRTGLLDEVVPVEREAATATARRLARETGILAGISAGAALAAATRVHEDGDLTAVVLPDTGERYLSTDLYADESVPVTEYEPLEGAGRTTPRT